MLKIFVTKRPLYFIAGLLAVLILQPILRADGPSTVPATSPEGKLGEQLQKASDDYADAMKELRKYVHTSSELVDPAKIKELGPQVIPILRRIRPDLMTLGVVEPDAKYAVIQWQAILAYWGDDQTAAELKQIAAGNSDGALAAKCSIILTEWWTASKDPAAQSKVVDDFRKIVQANSTDLTCVIAAMSLLELGAASADQTNAVLKILTDDVKNPAGAQEAAGYKAEKEADAKLAALENKPMTISGKQSDGKVFSTDSWKGKVILVDFWATWCAPCVAELPRVSKAYSDFHDKGLEIVGISSDYQADLLAKFLSDHKDMAWPQLFDPTAASNEKLHPLADSFGVTMLPEMFLIDKKGICRTVKAGENFEELIPKLLAE